MLPLLGGKDAAGRLQTLLEHEAGGKILGHDLYLYVRQKASVWGIDSEYISAAGLDDLECVWGCTQGFLSARETRSIPVLCVFDSEEVGSCSAQGAGSGLLETVLERICKALDLDLPAMLAGSMMLSADNAHALHPNHPELSDANNAPVPGKGVVLKFNANLRYTTDGASAAVFRKVCDRAQVPVQTYYNRADLPGGSTLGNISLAHVSVLSADIGLAQLAMHSCYETASVLDALHLCDAMEAFYSSALEQTGEGNIRILAN
jgi:aspartyl aminopeptidase